MFVFIGRMRVSSEYTEALGGGAGRGVREGDVSEHVHVMWDIRAGMLGVYVSSSLCMLFPNGVEGLALAFFFFFLSLCLLSLTLVAVTEAIREQT